MQNFIFNKKWLIYSSLLPLFFLNPLAAEDDGFFMGVSYQTSLAVQRVDNSGLNASQDASTYIRQNAVALESAAVPLAYYLEAMGQQTRVLMQMLCPDPSKRCLLYAGGYQNGQSNNGDSGNNPPRGNVNATFDMQSLVNNLNKLTQLIGETLLRNPENLPNAKVFNVKFGNQSTVIALPEGLANVMDALNNDITNALTTLWYNQTLTNKSFSAPSGSSVSFSPEVLQHLLQDGLATASNNQTICSTQNQCTATNEAKSIAQNAQNIFQALMQAGILGGLANEKQFGFTYNKAPNGSNSQQGYQSFSGPGYYTKNGTTTQAPLKALPAGATVGSGNGQYTYHPSSAVYYLADSIIANGITASMIFSGMQNFANKAAKLTGTSSYSQMQDAINYGESLLSNTVAYGDFITNWVAPYLDLNNKGLNFLPNYGGQLNGANSQTPQNSLTPQQAQQEQKVIMNQLEQATNAPTPAQIDRILANPYSPTAKTLMAYGLYRSKAVIGGVIDEMQTKVNQVYQMGFARNFLEHNSNSNNMNGFGVKIGYKQFFGKKRMFGLRYYGFYDFGYAQFGAESSLVKATLSSYGAGTDFLYNVFTRKRGTEAIDIGFFAGIQLAGQTWKTNFLDQVDGNHLKPKDTSFQLLFDLGIRTNFSKIQNQRRSRFSQGIEFGLKIPVLYHTYYQSEGVTAKYRRAFSFYVGYNIGF
ncbi:Hop family outer membrane protein HopI [Helicobacter pylori]|uniref:Hop family outer membrane protein HopI n=1 Tax=Helicobacter pylori TaxID=210 RepID=UPI0012E75A0D|nr:Hop family outer membrane protein HopI [Helicobacter pylori]MUU55397.1 Hop family outer membrane protein HopI [Helicobacter pylori]WQV77190.1 Hop family outer membrane protein HopI [Helicobacter pylori]